MTIDDFRGQVRISQIQAAFDDIVGNINNMIDTYNLANSYEDVDYTKGGTGLSAPSYSLSVGGLKTVLTNYNNTLVGCNVFKINDTTCLVTDGLFITSNQVYRIKDTFVNGNVDWNMSELYYDIDNDNVIYKQGSHGVIVDSQGVYNQPTINSNTEYGVFYAGRNAQDAYKITKSEGYVDNFTINGTYTDPYVIWQFPKPVKINRITLNAECKSIINEYATIVVRCDNEVVYNGVGGYIDIPLQDRETSYVDIYANTAGLHYGFITKFSNLVVSGLTSSIGIQQGGLIIPSPNIIKICDLNWNAKDGLIKDVKALQIEKPKNYTLTSSDRIFDDNGLCNHDGLDTTSSGKFVQYTAAGGGAGLQSEINIFGEQIIRNDDNSNGDRGNTQTNTSPVLYIPKGCTDNLYSVGGAGRSTLNAIFKYNQ